MNVNSEYYKEWALDTPKPERVADIEDRSNRAALDYMRQVESYIQQHYAYYSPALGQPAKPRACAYCGTKHDGSGRCDSCGAPNRV